METKGFFFFFYVLFFGGLFCFRGYWGEEEESARGEEEKENVREELVGRGEAHTLLAISFSLIPLPLLARGTGGTRSTRLTGWTSPCPLGVLDSLLLLWVLVAALEILRTFLLGILRASSFYGPCLLQVWVTCSVESCEDAQFKVNLRATGTIL